jgi:chemotaxis protein MotB
VLRVDGHTDVDPIQSNAFQSNWELSSARAISVVKFMVTQGVQARHLVAAGFGEFQPLVAGSTEDAKAENRRIELKLTER